MQTVAKLGGVAQLSSALSISSPARRLVNGSRHLTTWLESNPGLHCGKTQNPGP